MKRFKVKMTNTYETELYYYAEDHASAVECCKSDNGRFEKELEQCNLVDEVYVASLSEERKINAAYWVLGFGMDCDRVDKCRVTPFSSRLLAYKYATEQNEFSDGRAYGVTDSVDELRKYCDGYMTDWTKYIHISVLEDTNS